MRLISGREWVGEGRHSRFIMGHEAGTPDLMAFKRQENKFGSILLNLLFIEVKVPGNKPTALQKAKMEELEE